MVIRTNDRKNRIWERPKDEDILIEAKSEIDKYYFFIFKSLMFFKALNKEKSLWKYH